MDNKKVINIVNEIEAHLDLINKHVTVLKKELADSGASKSSARKGKSVISEKEKARVLAKVQKKRIKNSNK